jgi:SAM-dependent methyltransferase
MSLAGFAQLQTFENRLVAPLVDEINPAWVLELAPMASSSPALNAKRERLLVDRTGVSWPFSAQVDALPLDSESVPLVLLRHLWQPGVTINPLTDIARVLKPGGTLISVTANPWHRKAWQVLGRQALWLPSWPRWQILHAQGTLEICTRRSIEWKALVPGLSPVLILVARKPRRPAQVKHVKFGQPVFRGASAAVSQCRAA